MCAPRPGAGRCEVRKTRSGPHLTPYRCVVPAASNKSDKPARKWTPGSNDPFVGLTEGLASRFRADAKAGATQPTLALTALRRRPTETAARVGLLCSIAGAPEISPRDKQLSLALTLHFLQMREVRSPSKRLALVEAALRISDTRRQTRTWVEELTTIYNKLRVSGAGADWQAAFGLSRASAIGFCDHIRRIRRQGEWTDPLLERAVYSAALPDLTPGVSSGVRVTSVKLDGYRACPGTVELDLTVRGKPASLVVFGDNGVGKSTLVSAIELACQGTVGRTAPGHSESNQSLINLSSPRQQASVSVTLSNGSSLERIIEGSEGRWQVAGDQTPFDFSLAPITLQRGDLVRFLGTPGSQRGQLFVGQFAAASSDPAARLVRDRASKAKAARKHFVETLAGRAGHPPRVGTEYVLRMLDALYLDGEPRAQHLERGAALPIEYTRAWDEYREIDSELTEAKAAVERLPRDELQSHAEQVKRLGSLLGDVDRPLTEALVAVTGYSFIDQVNVGVGTAGGISLTMEVKLKTGARVPPERLFSEGVQDLLAILFFIEVAKAAAARGQAKVLVLDDVIQSVDATVRRRLLHHITTDLRSWQLVITCHDRLWRDHVKEALKKAGILHGEVAIRSWSFEGGPLVSSSQSDAATDLRAHVRRASPRTVAGSAGLLLETVCNHLSWILPVTITRAREDRYTLGELWNTVRSKAKNSPELSQILDDIDRVVSLRNQLGAHYNAIAESIADSEADSFADLVLDLWDRVFCSECSDYVAKVESKHFACRCGAVAFTT